MRYSQHAERDILDIWLYVAASSIAQADSTLDPIKLRCSGLDKFPLMGPSKPGIFPGARILVISRWLAIYRIENAGPQIVRVVDTARDLSSLTYPPD